MLNPNRSPVASLERLKELGLSVVDYGSCSEPRKVEIEGKGRVLVNRGCIYRHECRWAHVPMPDPDAEHMRPRPRMVKTRIIKPSPTGRGDIMRESYCSCFQWHEGLKNRDGQNNELTEVVGGEGDPVILRGTREEKRLDGSLSFPPQPIHETIPVFPDPSEAQALSQDVYTAAIKKSAKEDRRQQRRDQRMGIAEHEVNVVEVDPDEIHRAIAEAGQSSP